MMIGATAMQSSLSDHIVGLRTRIQALEDRLTVADLTHQERARLVSLIQVGQLALSHYQEAYELEQKVA
jgi:hypothetical protein